MLQAQAQPGRVRRFLLRRPVAAALGVAAVLALPGTGLPLSADDFLQQLALRAWRDGDVALPTFADAVDWTGFFNAYAFLDGDAARTTAMRHDGVLPWWVLPEMRVRFWRPLASAGLVFDSWLFGDAVAGHRLHTLAWFLALVATYGAVLRRALPGSTLAALSVLLIALSDHHVLPVLWLANRHALLSAALAGTALLCHLRWREDGWRPGAVLGPLCFALALGAGETGLCAAGFLLAYELGGAPRRDLRRLAPYVLVGAAWAVLYRFDPNGSYGSGMYTDPSREPASFGAALLARLPVLLSTELTGLPAVPYMVARLRPAMVAVSLVATGLFAWALRAAWPTVTAPEARGVRWLAAGGLLALLPNVGTIPSERLLMVPELGLTPLVAVVLRSAWRAGRPRTSGGVFAWLLMLRHVALAPLAFVAATAITYRNAAAERRMAEAPELRAALGGVERLVVVTAADPSVYLYLRARWLLERRPLPAKWFYWAIDPRDHTLEGTGPRTYELSTRSPGMLDPALASLFRGAEHPMQPGDTVAVDGQRVTVLEAEDGHVHRVRIELDQEPDATWLFTAWVDGALRPITLPRPGERLELPWSPGPLGL